MAEPSRTVLAMDRDDSGLQNETPRNLRKEKERKEKREKEREGRKGREK